MLKKLVRAFAINAFALMVLVCAFFGYLVAEKYYLEWKEVKLKSKFLSVPGVKRVVSYLDYEGGLHVTLEVAGGKTLSISGFDFFSIFDKSGGEFYLQKIDDFRVICLTGKGDNISRAAVDIGALIHASKANFELQGIEDLVSRFDMVHRHLKSVFPEDVQKALPIRVKNASGKIADHWCHGVTTSKQP
jgi:hypothetical protein